MDIALYKCLYRLQNAILQFGKELSKEVLINLIQLEEAVRIYFSYPVIHLLQKKWKIYQSTKDSKKTFSLLENTNVASRKKCRFSNKCCHL